MTQLLPPIEIQPPDISAWSAGNTGVPYVWSFDAATPGPHVAIAALTHGNEYCGAIAVDALLRAGVRPTRGRLSFVFVNIDAYLAFDRAAPFANRCQDEDLNRLWDVATLDGPRSSRDLTRARALRPFFDTVDHLLDLHSMQETCPPLLLCGASAKGLAQARRMGLPQHVLVDAGHSAGRRLFDYADFSDAASTKTAYLVECGQHWEASAETVARESCARFLSDFDCVAQKTLENALNIPSAQIPAEQIVITISEVVTVNDEAAFRWTQPWASFSCVPNSGTLLATEGAREIRTPHDNAYLVMPSREPKSGHTAVRLGVAIRGT